MNRLTHSAGPVERTTITPHTQLLRVCIDAVHKQQLPTAHSTV